MREYQAILAIECNALALDGALKSVLPGKVLGVSTYGTGRPISVWLDDVSPESDNVTVDTVVAAHDPVFISADKASISANGTDTVTISVRTAKAGAAAVTLVVTKPDTSTVTQSVTMSNGAGSVQFKTQILGIYTIAVQNGSNRCADALSVQAV